MKPILILLLLLPLPLFAEHFFKEVKSEADIWQVQFQSEGIRYRIEVDGEYRGISGYLQILALKKNEELKLTEKHQSILIQWSEKKEGIEITISDKDIQNGQTKVTRRFEPSHKSNQPNQPEVATP